MSKRNKKLKLFSETVERDWDPADREQFKAPKGAKPRSRDRKKAVKRAYYDD